MNWLKEFVCSALLMSAGGLAALELKSPDVPFLKQSASARQEKSVFSGDSIVSGSKTLLWCSNYNCIQFLNREQMQFGAQIWSVPSDPAWAPFTKFRTETKEKDGTVTRIHEFKLDKNAGGIFRQTISLRTDGKAEIVSCYEVGKNLPLLKNQSFRFFFPLHMIQGKKLRITEKSGKTKTVSLPETREWSGGKKNPWIHSGWFPNVRRIVFDPDSPAESFALEFPDTMMKHFLLFRAKEGAYLQATFREMGKPFRILVDFGKSSGVSSTDNVVNGINFTRNNGYEVSVFNEKGNLFLNPSFESGARYFHDHSSGFDVRSMLTTQDARSGRYSLLLTRGAKAFTFPTQANRSYTVSFYAKSPDGSPKRVSVRADHYFGGRSRTEKSFQIRGTAWQRYEMSFLWPYRSAALQFSGNGALIDDLQFEEGKKASAYSGNKIGIELRTASPQGSCVEEGKAIRARLLVRGPAGVRGRIRTEIVDFFQRNPYHADLKFELPASGETEIPLAPDSAFHPGVNRIRLRVEPEGLPAYTDFLRLSLFRYADNSSRNKNLHAIPLVGWPGTGQLRIPDGIFEMMKHCGIGTFSYGNLIGSFSGPFSQELSKKIFDRYQKFGFDTWSSLLTSTTCPGKKGFVFGIDGVPLVWNGVELKEMKTYSPEVLKKVEDLAYRVARKYPWAKNWNAPTEPIGSFRTLKEHRVEEYAGLVLAMYRGLKRGNPEILFSPYGICNLTDVGRKEVYAFLEAARKVDPNVKFRTIDAHPYREFTELPDTDADYVEFRKGLRKIGYGDIQVRWFEGAYFYPLIVAQWQGISPWQAVLTKDGYFSQHVPSYDLGWGERVATALLMRHWLVAYKYQDELKMACTWVPRFLDGDNPFALFVMSAAMTDLLGNSTFRKDLRFAPGARAYLFEDEKKRAVAAVWKFEEELDRGTRIGNEMLIDLKGMKPEFIDLMGGRCNVPSENGTYRLPLSNFPFYIRVEPGSLDALAKAINQASVSGSDRLPVELTARMISRSEAEITVINPLSRPLEAELSINTSPMKREVFQPLESKRFRTVLKQELPFNRFRNLSIPVGMKFGGRRVDTVFRMNVLPVREVGERFDWNTVPAVPVEHIHPEFDAKQNGITWGGPSDLSAVCRIAWNSRNLYLRFEVTDDRFVLNLHPKGPHVWYDNDAIQLFFDSFGNARESARRGRIGFDQDDYSYELLPTSPNRCVVYRRHVPDHQLTGGVDGGLKGNVLEDGVKCEFSQSGTKRIYTVTFPARYLMPMSLEAGKTPGIGIKIYDRDSREGHAKQNLSNIPLKEGDAFQRPDLYTQLLFVPGMRKPQ